MAKEIFEGACRKIERANRHIEEFEKCSSSFRKEYTAEFVVSSNPSDDFVTADVLRGRPIPEIFSTIIGDVVHNLRTSLDHLAWEAMLLVGATPSNNTYFPFGDTAKEVENRISLNFKGATNNLQDLIRSIGPCKDQNINLWALNQLDRIDKHRTILLVIDQKVIESLNVRDAAGNMMFGNMAFKITGEAGMKGLFAAPPGATFELSQNSKVDIDIAFGSDVPYFLGRHVHNTLRDISSEVSAVAGRFKAAKFFTTS